MQGRDYSDYTSKDLRRESPPGGSLAPFTFVCVTLILLFTGLAMLYSASYPEAVSHGLEHYHYVLRQGAFAVLGILGAAVVNFIPEKWIKLSAIPVVVISLVCMLLTLFSPWGVTVMGARRWLDLPGLPQFQPSEIAKLSFVIFLPWWFSSEKTKKYMGWHYVVPIALALVFALLIVAQRAYTTTILFLIICFVLFAAGGLKLRHLFAVCAFLAVPAIFLLLSESYRVKRIASFFFPELDPSGLNWQVNMSLSAIAEGGLAGKGIGNGEYKHGLLPEVQNDFILPSIIEETGFVGFLFIAALFILFAILGYRSAERLEGRSQFWRLVAIGVTTMVIAQVLMNIAVVTGLMPPTGIPLPFFSQGGTNLFVVLVECGLLYRAIRISAGGDL